MSVHFEEQHPRGYAGRWVKKINWDNDDVPLPDPAALNEAIAEYDTTPYSARSLVVVPRNQWLADEDVSALLAGRGRGVWRKVGAAFDDERRAGAQRMARQLDDASGNRMTDEQVAELEQIAYAGDTSQPVLPLVAHTPPKRMLAHGKLAGRGISSVCDFLGRDPRSLSDDEYAAVDYLLRHAQSPDAAVAWRGPVAPLVIKDDGLVDSTAGRRLDFDHPVVRVGGAEAIFPGRVKTRATRVSLDEDQEFDDGYFDSRPTVSWV